MQFSITILLVKFMKLIRIMLLLCIFLCLCSCSDKTNEYPLPDYPIIETPDRIGKESADGYRDIPMGENQEQATVYYANKESKKIHIPSCHYAKKMAETKIRIEQDKNLLLSEGYTNCSFCNP